MHYVPLAVLAVAAAPAFATEYLSAEEAQKLIFPEADAFRSQPLALQGAQMRAVEELSHLPARSVEWRVVGAYRGTELLGYVVLDEVVGKVELISYAVGINPDASLRQVEILTYRESHGGEVRLPAWRKQFAGKTAKAGGLTLGEGIDNISGATLSCTHLTDGVRRIAAVAQVALAK
jgi:Na+-translocating ferredoxin:NAD+ oxidoreductase RnfG subunit